MNQEQCHVLNGDALLHQFPEDLAGERIITRECFIEGDAACVDLESLYKKRAKFLSAKYELQGDAYFEKTVQEFDKLNALPESTEINLWFEDDLFCQTNFWFICYLVDTLKIKNRVFLVRPTALSLYGFSAYTKTELAQLYEQRIELKNLDLFVGLWHAYVNKNHSRLKELAEEANTQFPFLVPAVEAEIARYPRNGQLGLPEKMLREIIAESDDSSFGAVFKKFTQRAAIYGFGDSQIKPIYDKIIADFKE